MRSNTLPYWGSFLLFAVLCGCGQEPSSQSVTTETTPVTSAAEESNAATISPPKTSTSDSVAGQTESIETSASVEKIPEETTDTSWILPETTSVASKPVVRKLTVPTNETFSSEVVPTSQSSAIGDTLGATQASLETTETPVNMTPQMETPQAAVTAFLNAIRDGNNSVVEEMLSNRARKNVTELGLVVTPPADPSMEFTLGAVEQLGETGATVTCEISSDAETSDGQRIRQTVPYHWVLRREPVRGWRVAGATMKVQADEPPVMFDFESLEETLRKIAAIEQSLTR